MPRERQCVPRTELVGLQPGGGRPHGSHDGEPFVVESRCCGPRRQGTQIQSRRRLGGHQGPVVVGAGLPRIIGAVGPPGQVGDHRRWNCGGEAGLAGRADQGDGRRAEPLAGELPGRGLVGR
jgi:hypothetical protein